MARGFQFDVDRVVKQLDRILQMELAGVIYYTHYSFMIYGHRGFRLPPGCATTQQNRWPMLKRRVR
jgi:hypothetical protein